MAYGTNKKTRATIQRSVTSVDKSTGKKTVKKYPAKEMKSKSITEKEFNSNGKTKAAPAPKKASPSKKKDSKTLDMITKAPGYVVTYPLKKTLDIGIAAGNKLKQMKSDYETGKKMRERQEFKAKGGKSIKQKISESVKTYNKMQSSKKKSK
jgi:hypothetical protein